MDRKECYRLTHPRRKFLATPLVRGHILLAIAHLPERGIDAVFPVGVDELDEDTADDDDDRAESVSEHV